MSEIRVLIVDDEYLALNLLEQYISSLPELKLVGRATNPIEAQKILNENKVDLLFTDIQMPLITGIEFIKTLIEKPLIVFTTAYSEHAIEAYELNVIDYLLKPFTFQRFLQAVTKAKAQIKPKSLAEPIITASTPSDLGTISLKSEGKIVRINLDDISYVESLKEYIIIHGTFGKHIVLERLKNMEEQLPSENFLRVHKSFIIAKNKVTALNGNQLEIGDKLIPISRERKKEVINTIFY